MKLYLNPISGDIEVFPLLVDLKGGSLPDTPPPTPLPPPPSIDSSTTRLAKYKQRDLSRRRAGFESTILTSGLGLMGKAPGVLKTLLGE